LNNEILKKVDEIISLINESNEYKKYLKVKEKLEDDQVIKTLVNEIKILQKDVVHHLSNEEVLIKKQRELESIPLYREYQNTLDELNNTYNIIENTLNNYFDKTLN
jgi:cell fate (sporulation/competence/biofilm development) regulator YmcA (YheA/YmcA/DUF963 family)